MANIYQISQELLSIFDEIEENDGELTEELEEKLSIKQETFKSKIKSYTDVIKYLNNDINSIKEEIARLKDLQQSKERIIEKIKKIIINAIETFGDNNSLGVKFIDLGTSKVSIRNSKIVEVNEDIINRFVNKYITALKWYDNNNQLQQGIVTSDELLEFANGNSSEEDKSDITKLSFEDLANIKANINTEIKIDELLQSDKGFNLVKALIEYGIFTIKAKADKIAIKKDAKEKHIMPVYATLIENKSINIK